MQTAEGRRARWVCVLRIFPARPAADLPCQAGCGAPGSRLQIPAMLPQLLLAASFSFIFLIRQGLFLFFCFFFFVFLKNSGCGATTGKGGRDVAPGCYMREGGLANS